MNDYCAGIAYATGCLVSENGNAPYLVVRNIDKFYPKTIASETGYKSYPVTIENRETQQWAVKVRNVHEIPCHSDVSDVHSFLRAYVEIHGVLDAMNCKKRNGEKIHRLRLRIYGNLDIISYINYIIPVPQKSVQEVVTQTGRTYALYYQSKNEILDILDWISGEPCNIKIWNSWKSVIESIG